VTTKNFRFEYRWADGVQIKKPIEVSAPKYVEYLMDWIETQLDDESIFPQKMGTSTVHWISAGFTSHMSLTRRLNSTYIYILNSD
jgi:hypothetical protein